MKTENALFYSRSNLIYGTAQEAEEIEFIQKSFPDYTVIHPNDLGEVKYNKKYLKIVGKCTMVVVSERNGFVSRGAYATITRAFSCDIPVKVIREKEREFYYASVYGIQIYREEDWKRKYAQLIIKN